MSSNKKEKILLIGIDGMDPKIINRLMKEGKLPNFEKLKKSGRFDASWMYPPFGSESKLLPTCTSRPRARASPCPVTITLRRTVCTQSQRRTASVGNLFGGMRMGSLFCTACPAMKMVSGNGVCRFCAHFRVWSKVGR